MILAMETAVVCARLGEEQGLRLIRDAGFDGVDYTFFTPESIALLGEDYLQNAKRTKALLEELGLQCRQAHAPFRYEGSDPFALPFHTSVLRSIEYAALLGAQQIIIHPVNAANGADYVDSNLRYLGSFGDTARRFGIRIGIENGPPSHVINELLEKLEQGLYVCCVDVGHCNEPARNYHPQNMIAEIASGMLQALHLHDNKGMVGCIGDDHNLPYLGIMDWESILRALADRNYPGDLTLEIVGYLEALPPEVYPQALALAHGVGRDLQRRLTAMLAP
ncbi:MAG: sugar phosphate isomerase/epimerase [Oscillospiraceae bacterium]|nr:sugar phosphate isomerase/epimerase [Oscillospiraceae bacterium]